MKTRTFGILAMLAILLGLPQAISAHSSHHRDNEFKGHYLLVPSSSHSSGKLKPAINPQTHQPYFFVFVNNKKSKPGAGTFESPYNTLLAAQYNSAPGDIIYVFEGDGTSTGMDMGITLKDYQRLWGASIQHKLKTKKGEVTIGRCSKHMPMITNTSGSAIVVADGNVISGIHVLANATVSGILLGDIEDCTICHNTIDVVGSSTVPPPSQGVVFNGCGGKIEYEKNVMFQTNGLSTGINFASVASDATFVIKRNEFNATVGEGAQGIEFGKGPVGINPPIVIGDFDQILIIDNVFAGQGSTAHGIAIGGFGFDGTGHLVISKNHFVRQTTAGMPLSVVTVQIITGADLLVDVTDNVWQETVNPTVNASLIVSNGPEFAPFPGLWSICLNLTGNVSDNTFAAYVLANTPTSPAGTFTAQIGSNVGFVLPISGITPGTCP